MAWTDESLWQLVKDHFSTQRIIDIRDHVYAFEGCLKTGHVSRPFVHCRPSGPLLSSEL